MSTAAIARPASRRDRRTPAEELALRLGEALVAWAERPRDRGVDVERLARAEDRRADARFAEPLGLHHWLR
ncbi:hypothetical protein [Sinomonas sp. RB5]